MIKEFLKKVYIKYLELADNKRAPYILAATSFFDAALIPLPPDFILVPMCLTKPARMSLYIIIAGVSASFGGIFGYFLGYLFGSAFIDVSSTLALENLSTMQEVLVYLHKHGVWILIVSAFLPIPFKIFTISSGVLQLPVWSFILAAFISRAIKFFLLWRLIKLTKTRNWKFKLPRMLFEEWHKVFLSVFALLIIIYIGFKW